MLASLLPLELSAKSILFKEPSVVGPEFSGEVLAQVVAVSVLGVQIESIEEFDPLQSFFIFGSGQVFVGSTVMPWIGRMVSDHIKTFGGNCRFVGHQHTVHVFIVSPCKHEVVKTAVRFVHAVFGIVSGVMGIRIEMVEFRKDDGITGDLATHHKGVASQGPLFAIRRGAVLSVFSRAPQEHDFAHVMKEARQLHPIGMSRSSNPLGGLQKMQLVGKI
mmetsp:Transcript_32718/g.75324  ORF Transcript_32718/g.75324 Transcript_32718/m.75324 type:complete len:218 (+) Transcript_32718:997-1650(+)